MFNPALLMAGSPASEIRELTKKGDQFMASLDFEAASPFYHKALQKALIMNNNTEISQIRNLLTESLWKSEKPEEAEKYAYENLAFCLQNWGWNHTETATTLENLGGIANLMVVSDIQYTFFFKALEINRKIHGNAHISVALNLQMLGWLYEKYADSANSRKYLFESLAVWKKNRAPNHPDLAELYRYIGLIYRRWDVRDSSRYYFTLAKTLFDAKYGEANIYSVKCLNNLAGLYEYSGRRDTAFAIYRHVLGLLPKIRGYKRNVTVMTWYAMSDNYLNLKNYEKALSCVQQVFTTFFPGFAPRSDYDNPAPDWTRFYPYLVHTTHLKLQIVRAISYRDGFTNKTDQCVFELVQILDYLQDQMRLRTFLTDLQWKNENYQIGENLFMTELAMRRYKTTGDTVYMTRALNFLSKNQQYLETVTTLTNSPLSDFFPANLISERQGYLNQISELQIRASALPASETKFKLLDGINEQRILLNALNIKMTKNDRHFSEILNRKTAVYLGSIQKRLKMNQVLMFFFETPAIITNEPRRVFQIIISSNNAFIREIGSYRFTELCSGYRKAITDAFPQSQIDSIGFQLYQSIFEKYSQLITGKELIIIPSTQTASIPLDLLPVSNAGNPRYIIHDHLVWYFYSLGHFMSKAPNINFERKQVLSFVPSFSKSRKAEISQLTNRDSGMIELPGALAECLKISELVPSELVNGEIATEKLFRSKYRQYPVIHLSTHGLSTGQKYYADKLAFSKPEKGEDGYLNFSEILTLKFRTEMVVLSACKTGIGNPNNSVVNMNLGWAFRQAGVKSVLMSLWDANDYSSSVIMPQFFKYLAEGYTRPEALRKAKLDYLATADDWMRQPLYWAGFQYYGNNEPVKTLIRHRLDYVRPGMVLLILGLFILFTPIIIRKTRIF